MLRARLACPLLMVLAALPLARVGRAQEPPAAAQPAAPAEPATIPLPALVIEAEAAERFAAGVAAPSAADAELAHIERDLADLAPEIERQSARLRGLTEAPTSLDALEGETRAWQTTREQLGRWQRTPTDRLQALDEEIGELSSRRDLWRRTREAAVRGQAPAEAIARIDAVSGALRRADARAKSAQRGLIELQARIAHRMRETDEALASLAAAKQLLQTSLFVRDSVPLWRALTGEARPLGQAQERIALNWSSLRSYREIGAPRAAAQLAIFAAAALLALRTRRRTERLSRDPRLAASAIIFERPFSSAALLALGLTPVLHPAAPTLLVGTARLLLIGPVLRLLPALVEPALRPAIWAAALLAAVDALRGPLAAVPSLERAIFTVQLAAASGALIWMMRPARLALVADPERVPRLLNTAMRVALGLLLAAFAASVLGWSNLGHLVGNGVLRSAYAAIVLYGGARVLRAGLRAALGGDTAARLNVFRGRTESAIARAARAVNLAGIALWAGLTLAVFGLLDDLLDAASAFWAREIGWGSLSLTIGDVLTFVLTLWAAVLFARFVRFVLEGDVLARLQTRRGIARAVAQTAQYVLLLLGFFLAAAAAGIDMNRFAVLAGAFGVGIGFGLQNIVNNFVSGLILLYERPIQVGDVIEVGGVTGEVWRIGVRSSTVRTADGAEVIVPNATLIAERVSNWTLSDRARRVDVAVGVAYGSDPRRVLELLVGCARAHTAVLSQPEPIAIFQGFGDSALLFELRVWTLLDRFLDVKNEMALAVHDALTAAGLEIPYPQRDLRLRAVAPDAAQALSRGDGGTEGS